MATSRRAKIALAGAAGAVALSVTALVKPWEGKRNLAYQDIVGVWTVCYGETKGVKKGMWFSDVQCDRMLMQSIEDDYHKPLVACIAGFDTKPISWQASMLSLAYNIGTPKACYSTAARLARFGRYAESCKAMTAFNRAGKQVSTGLKKRRENGDATRIGEYELCMAGL